MTFEEWDPDIVKEEEGVDGDNHDQTNLAAQELSKFVLKVLCPTTVNVLFCFNNIFYNITATGIWYGCKVFIDKYMIYCYSLHSFWMSCGSQHHQTCKTISCHPKNVFIFKHWTTEFH